MRVIDWLLDRKEPEVIAVPMSRREFQNYKKFEVKPSIETLITVRGSREEQRHLLNAVREYIDIPEGVARLTLDMELSNGSTTVRCSHHPKPEGPA